jgi:ribosomal protein L37AE/L43A
MSIDARLRQLEQRNNPQRPSCPHCGRAIFAIDRDAGVDRCVHCGKELGELGEFGGPFKIFVGMHGLLECLNPQREQI